MYYELNENNYHLKIALFICKINAHKFEGIFFWILYIWIFVNIINFLIEYVGYSHIKSSTLNVSFSSLIYESKEKHFRQNKIILFPVVDSMQIVEIEHRLNDDCQKRRSN